MRDIIIICLLAIIAAFLIYRFALRKPRRKKGHRIADIPAVVTSIRKIAELATACFFEEKILVEKKANAVVDNKIGELIAGVAHKDAIIEDELCLIAKGQVRAGYDLRDLKEDDLKYENNILTIKLPEVKILEVIINPKGWDIYVEDGTWSDAQIRDIKLKAKELVKADALENGILEKAAKSGSDKIKALMLSLGYKNVVVG